MSKNYDYGETKISVSKRANGFNTLQVTHQGEIHTSVRIADLSQIPKILLQKIPNIPEGIISNAETDFCN